MRTLMEPIYTKELHKWAGDSTTGVSVFGFEINME